MTGSPSNPSDELIFAPAGISHLTGDNADLVRSAAAGRSQLRMTTAAQLNGVPPGHRRHHADCVRVRGHCSEVLDLPALIVFDALENAPAEHLEFDGEVYTRSVGDLIDTGQIDSRERTAGFEQLLAWAQRRSGISYEFRPYSVYQSLRPVRECLHQIASRPMDFAPIVAPRERIIRIRPRCPSCRRRNPPGICASPPCRGASHWEGRPGRTVPSHGGLLGDRHPVELRAEPPVGHELPCRIVLQSALGTRRYLTQVWQMRSSGVMVRLSDRAFGMRP